MRVIKEEDELIERIAVLTQDNKAATVEVLQFRRLMLNDFDGSRTWIDGMVWCRCNGIEVTPQGDGTWASDGSPPLVLRRA